MQRVKLHKPEQDAASEETRVALHPLPRANTHPELARLGATLAGIIGDAPNDARADILGWLACDPVLHGDTGPLSVDQLAHRLSAFMTPFKTEFHETGRTENEWAVLLAADLQSPADVADAGYPAFHQMLLTLHSRLVPASGGLRTSEICSAKDRVGAYVRYPSPTFIAGRLREIHANWAEHIVDAPGFAAVIAMTALMNIHPFVDGNGRLGRTFFHWSLGITVDVSRPYLPLYELSALSQCGYLLRLREAQYHRQWTPLFNYLVMCARAFCMR
jgi:hypothetical protein